ncbi:MAG: hypothetical protein ACYTFW_14335 [Planctomycetota bacterium]
MPDCPAGTAPNKANPHHPTALELLDKYTRALDSTRSFTSKADIVSHQDFEFDENFDPAWMGTARAIKATGLKLYMRVEFCTDGKRTRRKQYAWGDISFRQRNVDETQPSYFFSNWDGNDFYTHASIANDPAKRGVAQIGGLRKDQEETQFCRHTESYLLGYYSNERLDTILRRAKRISVSHEMEIVGGSDCYVIKAETGNGTISLWLDPEHGYHAAKVETRSITGDLKRAKTVRTTRFGNVRFQKIDGIWVPMEADTFKRVMYDANGKKGSTREENHYKRTEFVLNPDHGALGSFDNPLESDPELLEGTPVHIHGDPIGYIWQDGQLVPDKDKPAPRKKTNPKRRPRPAR